MIEIKIGTEYIVEKTGNLITFYNFPVNINIEGMIIEIIFIRNPFKKELIFEKSIINDNLMRIEFFNFEDNFLYKNTPTEILSLNNKVYYLDFVISALGTERKLLNYMILSKEKK